MEGRMNKYRQVSPERAIVWTEKSPTYHYNYHHNQQQHTRKVPVVYYLCRNRQLEHPHFIEVLLCSSSDLYLRDVIERLNVLRGRGIGSMYSWSCKRSYKNGYVWQDLCKNDIIHPAHGNEYILKGSELFEESNPGRFSPPANFTMQSQKALPGPPSSRNKNGSSSSSSSNGRSTKSSEDDGLSPLQRPCPSALSPELFVGKNSSWNGSLSLTEYKIYKSDGLADASTQIEEKAREVIESRHTCTRGVSTDDGLSEVHQIQVSEVKQNQEICEDLVSPSPSAATAPSVSGRGHTLEALIRAEVRKLNRFRIPEEEEEEGFRIPPSTKLNVTNMIMQLISCGSVSAKDHSFGMIPTYGPRLPNSKFLSPLLSTSLMLGEDDCLAENPHLMNVRMKDKEYFSGGLAETSMLKEEVPTLYRSLSCNADRSSRLLDSVEDKEEKTSTSSKCIPKSIKASLIKHPTGELLQSPLSEGRRISSERLESSRINKPDTSNCGSNRMTEPISEENRSRKHNSTINDEENLIKIEESLSPNSSQSNQTLNQLV